MENNIQDSLDAFIRRYLAAHDDAQKTLKIEYDASWPSPCYQSEAQEGEWVNWRPVKQSSPLSFQNIEDALSLKLDKQYCEFFSRYWSEPLNAKAEDGLCQLLQVWNQDDAERLQENIIGHVLMKQRLKQTPTLFFGLTDAEDVILCVNNDTGEVVVEHVGKEPSRVLAKDLSTFLSGLTPAIVE